MNDFTCDQFKELMFDYIDDLLDNDKKLKFEDHIKNCINCSEEYQKAKKLLESIKESKFVIGNELYTALIPQIVVESKQKKKNNLFKKIRIYGSAAVAAVVMIIMVAYFLPISNIVNDVTPQAQDNSAGEFGAGKLEEQLYGNDDIYYEDIVVEECEEDIAETAEVRLYSVTTAQSEDVMSQYLNTYVPDYADSTDTLYICYDAVELPEEVVTAEVVTDDEYSAYVIDRFSNIAFDVTEVTNIAAVYNDSTDTDNVKQYVIIISFSSTENEIE